MALETICAATGLSIGDKVLVNGSIPCVVTEIDRDANLARLVEEKSNRHMRRRFNRVSRKTRNGATAA